jgi:hypothetical protein
MGPNINIKLKFTIKYQDSKSSARMESQNHINLKKKNGITSLMCIQHTTSQNNGPGELDYERVAERLKFTYKMSRGTD